MSARLTPAEIDAVSGKTALKRAREASADRPPTPEGNETLRAAAEGRGQRRYMGQCSEHGRAWSDVATGQCLACRNADKPRRAPVAPRLYPCELHGQARVWASTHGQCRKCYTRAGGLKRGLPLAKATVGWWARHEAHERGAPGYMRDCPAHGFTEHRTRTRECTRCRRGEPLRLRPL